MIMVVYYGMTSFFEKELNVNLKGKQTNVSLTPQMLLHADASLLPMSKNRLAIYITCAFSTCGLHSFSPLVVQNKRWSWKKFATYMSDAIFA